MRRRIRKLASGELKRRIALTAGSLLYHPMVSIDATSLMRSTTLNLRLLRARARRFPTAIELEVFTAIGEATLPFRKSLSDAKRQNVACVSFAITCASWDFLRMTAGVTV
jgi:hypothetical protein